VIRRGYGAGPTDRAGRDADVAKCPVVAAQPGNVTVRVMGSSGGTQRCRIRSADSRDQNSSSKNAGNSRFRLHPNLPFFDFKVGKEAGDAGRILQNPVHK
jgi:hypothetical protein